MSSLLYRDDDPLPVVAGTDGRALLMGQGEQLACYAVVHAHRHLPGLQSRPRQMQRLGQPLFIPNTNGFAFLSFLVTSPLSVKISFSTCSSFWGPPWLKSSSL